MSGKINRFLFFMLFMFLCNVTFAKGAAEICRAIYRDKHSEEWIREAVLAHPNVKEIVKMIKTTDSPQYRMYILMKDETKVILSGVSILDDNSIIGFSVRIGDYTAPRMLVYDTNIERYLYSNISAGYDNEKYQEYIDTMDLNFLLNNFKEIEEFFSSLPCLTKEETDLLYERREKEIQVLQNVDWEKVKKNYSYYVVLKADDFSWSQWKVE